MNDYVMGKRMIEDMMLDQVLDAFPRITGRTVTDDGVDGFPQIEGSPDFVIGLDGKAVGVEIAEIRNTVDAWSYYEEANRIAWKKHASYERRGLFRNPIILVLYSGGPPLYEIHHELSWFDDHREFEDAGFIEVWAADFSDEYYSAQDPRRPADMFCFKPSDMFGFHRIGGYDRKPWG